MELSPLTIVLIVLVCAGAWALVELALTLRRTRKVVTDLSESANDTIAEVKPVISKLDGIVDDLDPAVRQLEPLLDKTGLAVDALTLDLVRVNTVLEDVSTVTNTGRNVSDTLTGAANHVVAAVGGIAGKISGKAPDDEVSKLESAATADKPVEPVTEPAPTVTHTGDAGYFTYPGASASKED